MRRIIKTHWLFFAVVMILVTTPVFAQKITYHSKHLEAAARKLAISSRLDTLKLGVTYLRVKNQRIEVRISNDAQVEHIGIPLFSSVMRNLQPLPIYDYLEYALLDHQYHISDNPLDNVNLKFIKGSWAQMSALSDSTECSISNLEGKYYKVTWTTNGRPLVVVTFPVSYDMLASSTRREMEDIFIRDLRTYVGQRMKERRQIDEKALTPIDSTFYVKKGKTYLVNDISNDLYYRKIKGDSLVYVCEDAHPDMSMANLLLADDAGIPDAFITLKFIKYDFKTDSLALPVKTFVSYCRSKGCEVFYGTETVNQKKQIEGSLFFYNKDSGYDHVVSITAPVQSMGKKDYMIRGKVYLYAPMNNVKDLFYNPKKTPRKHIQFE